MSAALYATIWASLWLFAFGEAGKTRQRNAPPTGWAWRIWVLGALLCVVHMMIALGVRHEWSHQSAVEETARQTAALFGVSWRGGVYLNYLFVTVWLAEAWWWGANAVGYARRPRWVTWLLRSFYFIIIFNAAVVFASPAGRVVGFPLVAALLWVWRPSVH